MCTNITKCHQKHFKISHLKPQIYTSLVNWPQTTENTQRQTDTCKSKAGPTKGGSAKNKKFSTLSIPDLKSQPLVLFPSSAISHLTGIQSKKPISPTLFFQNILVSLIFWLNPPILPSKFSEIAHIRRKYKFSVCMQNTKFFFPCPISTIED